MVAVASREIKDGDVVFVGMRLPVLAYAVALSTHAPNARGLFEVGLMRDKPADAFLGTMGDPPNVAGALWATRMSNAMALMAQGNVALGFIGGAEVDRFGNLNTSYVGDPAKPRVGRSRLVHHLAGPRRRLARLARAQRAAGRRAGGDHHNALRVPVSRRRWRGVSRHHPSRPRGGRCAGGDWMGCEDCRTRGGDPTTN